MRILPGHDVGRSAVVVVAHPDDETIWCGGLILQNPSWDWTVLSLCRATDPDRRVKFRRACEHLDIEAAISDLDDSNPLKSIDPQKEIGGRIRDRLRNEDWDACITHGANGEYGHQRHKEVHREVLRLVGNGVLRCEEFWTFAYVCNPRTGHNIPRHDADIRVPLTAGQLTEKKRIIHEMYGYGRDSFEYEACISPETFHRHCVGGKGY